MARIIGIDLGTHAVKLALFQGGFGRFQLQGYRSAAVPQDGDEAPDLGARIETLRALLDSIPPEGRSISAVGFPAEHASVRLVTLPFGDRAQVEQTLPFEVENLVPFDLEKMVMASRILSVDPGVSKVLTAMVTKQRLRPLLSGLTEIGVDPKLLLLDADMLSDVAGPGVVAVIDIGHTRTLVTLCSGGHAVGARAIALGGRNLTLALAKARSLDFADAEARKHRADIYADEPTDEISEVVVQADDQTNEVTDAHGRPDGALLREALTPLLSEVRSSLVAFEDAHGVEVQSVVLTGGTAQLGGLREWIAAILGVPVRRAQVGEPGTQADEEPIFAIAHALATKAAGGKGRSLDFRLGEFAFRGDLAFMGTLIKAGAIAAAALMLLGVGWSGWRYISVSSQLAAVNERIGATVIESFPDISADRVKEPSTALAIMQERTTETTTRVEVLGAIIAEEPPTLAMISEISSSVPPPEAAPIDVQELSISPTNIVIKAETSGFEAAATIESSLKQSKQLKQAQKGDEQKKRDKVRFTITIPLETEGGMTDEG